MRRMRSTTSAPRGWWPAPRRLKTERPSSVVTSKAPVLDHRALRSKASSPLHASAHRGFTPATLPSTCTSGKASWEGRQAGSAAREAPRTAPRASRASASAMKWSTSFGSYSTRTWRLRVSGAPGVGLAEWMPCSGGRDAKALSVPRPTDNRRAADEPSWGAARRTWCGRRKHRRRAQLPWDGPGQGAAPAAPKLRCGAYLGGWRSRRREGVNTSSEHCATLYEQTTSRSSRAWGSTKRLPVRRAPPTTPRRVGCTRLVQAPRRLRAG